MVRLSVKDGKGKIGEKVAEMDEAAITEKFFAPRARSESPKKRGRQDDDDPAEMQDVEGVQESKKRKILGSQDTASTTIPSLTTTKSSGKSISVITARLNPVTALPEEHIIEYDCDDDGVDDPDPRIRDWYQDEEFIDRVRRLEVKRRRPYHKPELFCCDYDRKDRVCHAAVKEEGDWDAYHLCGECMGGEYELRAQDIVDDEHPVSPRLLEARLDNGVS
ncbi:MAG: hypothetical protein Q9219_005605 [cf. Caloplaca sp. 3 TL-2023]